LTKAMSLEDIQDAIRDLEGWSTDGRKIECTYSIPHIRGAALVMHIAAIQDGFGHHSDATLGFKSVRLSITSSDIGGYVAAHDIELARRIHSIAASHGAE
jgi:4a-hydroxytetrahydrobiopterin dehydratase